MIRMLVLSDHYYPRIEGGAEISLKLLVEELLKRNANYHVRVVSPDTVNEKGLNFEKIKILAPGGFSKLNNMWPLFDCLLLFNFLHQINAFKPHIILAQTNSMMPATLAARLKETPIITMIRDIAPFCPNKTGVKYDGNACETLFRLGTCIPCFLRWKSIANPFQKSRNKFNFLIKPLYVFQNIFRTLIGLRILNSNRNNLVSSKLYYNLSKKLLKNVSVEKMIPIDDISNDSCESIANTKELVPGVEAVKKLAETNKILLLSLPRVGGFNKGIDFIITQVFPSLVKPCILLIAGQDGTSKNPKIRYLGRVPTQVFRQYLTLVDILLVPSTWYESFGRVAIEGVIARNIVLLSPNVGAKDVLSSLPSVKVLPLDSTLWKNEIDSLQRSSIIINHKEIKKIIETFSPHSVAETFNKRIIKVLFKRDPSQARKEDRKTIHHSHVGRDR